MWRRGDPWNGPADEEDSRLWDVYISAATPPTTMPMGSEYALEQQDR
jgi:hypothetical protein